MALKKRIEDHAAGVAAEYWRVTSITLDVQGAQGGFTLAGYVSEAVRVRPNSVPIMWRTFQLEPGQFVPLAMSPCTPGATSSYADVASKLYAFIKSIVAGEFSDAEDV
jgi:hypothetical protein